MEAGSLTIGVAGATGAVGGEVVRQLAAARFPIRALVPMASPTCETHAIEFRGQSVVVRNLDDPSLEGCDVVLLAVPRPVAAGVIPELLERGIAVIDLTGVLADAGAPTVVAGVNPTELEAFTERRAVACPSPLVTAISSIMAPVMMFTGGFSNCTYATSSRTDNMISSKEDSDMASLRTGLVPVRSCRKAALRWTQTGFAHKMPDGHRHD